MHNRNTSSFRLSRRTLQLGAVMAAGVLALNACSKPAGPAGVSGEDMTKGADNAPITLVEYASVTCVHCADFHTNVLPLIEDKYIKTGKVKYVYKEYLTGPTDVSAAGVLIARCAGKDKYFDVIDQIMRSQKEMFADGTTTNARPVLQRIAAAAGVDFEACVKDKAALERVKSNWDRYISDGIQATPSFFINGKRHDYKGGGITEFDEAFAAVTEAK